MIDALHLKDWIILALCVTTIGLNKAGLRGVNIIVIPVFASYFGGTRSASTVLPLLLMGDLISVYYYRKSIEWSYLKRLLPSTLLGLAAGMVLGKTVPDRVFIMVMAAFIAICLVLMVYKEFGTRDLSLPDHPLAHGTAGFAGGFSTMVGNAAAPIMALYLLSMNLPKTIFIGTGAVFFMVVNLLKIPVHTMVWGSLTWETLKLSLMLSPFLFMGLVVGFRVVKYIPERPFRMFIISGTLIGTVKMILG
jgi:uncharacterized membrane protein YfcA